MIRHAVIPASRGGTLKTLAQGTAARDVRRWRSPAPLATLRFWVMMVAVVLTVVTGLDYVRQAVVLRRKGLAAERAAAAGRAAAEAAEEALQTAAGTAVGAGAAAGVADVHGGVSDVRGGVADVRGAGTDVRGTAEARDAAEAER
ncbi:hypothetical protein SBADM41S_08023 [Streptomyces badius]